MSAVLEPQAAEVEVIDRAEINNGKALVAYSRTEAGLLALKEDLAGKTYDLATVKGNEAARQDRQRCVSLRTALDKKRLEFKRPVLDIGKLIDAEAKRITDEILALEAPIDAAIKADEERREKIRLEKAAAEAERQQRHRDGIAKIRSYADAARLPGMTAERLLKGLSALEGMTIDPAAWEEFATEAAHVLAETTAAVKAEHAAMVEREAEAARLAQQAKEQAERKASLASKSKEWLEAAILDGEYNDFIRQRADNDGEDHGKRIPYIGWFWRHIEFSQPTSIPIGDCGEFIGFMANNKWDYPERCLTEDEAAHVRGGRLPSATAGPSSAWAS